MKIDPGRFLSSLIWVESPFFRVIAFDNDEGPNAQLSYSIKNGQTLGRFQINPATGTVLTTTSLFAGEQYELLVRATDGGEEPLSGMARVSVTVSETPENI